MTKRPERSPFTAKWGDTVDLLEREINFVIARGHPEVLIQVDAPEGAMRLDGGLRADARVNFHGVIISFESKHGPLSYSCDKYSASSWARSGDPKWQANVRAIALGLEALRKIERYGIADSGQQYTGWNALPPGRPMPAAKMTAEQAAQFIARTSSAIEIQTDAWRILLDDRKVLRARYRDAAFKLHPDHGGDRAEFDRLQEAAEVLEALGFM
jgi:hypothetical protein